MWDDPAVVNDLLKKGLFMRIYEPQVRTARLVRSWNACRTCLTPRALWVQAGNLACMFCNFG